MRRSGVPRIRIYWRVSMLILCLLLGTTSLLAQSSVAGTNTKKSSKIEVPGAKQWIDTNIDLRGGAKVRFTATGQITYPADQSQYESKTHTAGSFGPDGLARGFADLLHSYAVGSAGHGALIGRVGTADYAQAFLIGASKEFEAPVSGRLYLGLNESEKEAATATGSFEVTVEVLEEGSGEATALGGPAEVRISGVTPELLNKIPRRVSDPQNNPGDMVNVLIIGTQDEVVSTFTQAGWVKVDGTVRSTAMNAVLESLEKKDYLTMPMSILYLFNRPQDYGFAHAEPVRVAMSRNHLRVWKSPYVVNGRPLWCIAATHDIGFERDQRNNGVTHKIDPSIDGEREYVNGTLSGTGLVVQRDHVTPADPLTTAKTATGGEFHSDGRILVLVLKNTGK
jgi:LssY C-terminus